MNAKVGDFEGMLRNADAWLMERKGETDNSMPVIQETMMQAEENAQIIEQLADANSHPEN